LIKGGYTACHKTVMIHGIGFSICRKKSYKNSQKF